MTKKVCVIPGDDAMPEAVNPTVKILEGMGLPIEFNKLPGGEDSIRMYGAAPLPKVPDEIKKAIDEADCTLYGSNSNKNFSRIALGYLRWGLDCGCHLRPIKYLKGARSALKNPEGIDWVIIREGREGLYVRTQGELKDLAPLAHVLKDRDGKPLNWQAKGTYALRVTTEENTRKIARFGCEVARKRKAQGYPGKVAVTDKYNMLHINGEYFRRIAEEVVKKEYPDLLYEQFIVDDFARRVVERAHDLDVVIMPNEHADVLSDAASATVGGLGFGYSGCYGDKYAYFEPSAGSFPRAKGLNIINPTAMLLSSVLMLQYLGFAKEAQRLENAVKAVYEEGKVLTQDQGGKASTTQFCDAVAGKL
ncbi:MAG: isocitrate/isopropylmalate dehydrogenase family protein [Proteobacteria bacterium]|nr:isocitrate/isopropylmalate dehydrogenase family protein [Pseudomonadota bacterium]